MNEKIYVFVDGESHYQRSEAAVKSITDFASLSEYHLHSDNKNDRHHDESLRLFWEHDNIKRYEKHILRMVYFTTFIGNDGDIHRHSHLLRDAGFDASITKEDKSLYSNRKASAEKLAIIEKPKGVDIALSTRMVADAAKNVYDILLLATGDADYLPAIKAVREMGKLVYLFGYESAIGNPELLYVPDLFIDMSSVIRKNCPHNRRKSKG